MLNLFFIYQRFVYSNVEKQNYIYQASDVHLILNSYDECYKSDLVSQRKKNINMLQSRDPKATRELVC